MFNALGYPGVEKEVELALRNFPTEATSALDVSCGPGVITDALARSGRFQSVVAIDYSDEMVVAAERSVVRGRRYTSQTCAICRSRAIVSTRYIHRPARTAGANRRLGLKKFTACLSREEQF